VGCAERLYIRLFAWRSGNHSGDHAPDVLVLDASEIASISIRTTQVYLYGPKPKSLEWLVIEPAKAVAESISNHIRPLLTPEDSDKAVLVTCEGGRLSIEWKWWCPALPVFIQQVTRESPSIPVGCEERSEVDLNGIWNGIRWAWRKPDAQQRQLLA
jgi:hypothetical protein